MLQMSAVSTMGVNCLLVLVARVLLVLHHVEVVAGALVTREAVQHYHQQAVPVIHLDQGKATVDDLEHYLRMFPEQLLGKQAENGLQSRSSKNSKTAVWHYGLKLQ